jgi:hypothetical protein
VAALLLYGDGKVGFTIKEEVSESKLVRAWESFYISRGIARLGISKLVAT